MSLSDLASIAIIVQGVFFVVSIILVWYQLRENTNLIRTSNTQKLVELSSPFYLQLAQDRSLAELWLRGMENNDLMDEIDRSRYMSLMTWWLMMHENIYHQWRKKLIEEDTYESWTRDLEFFAHRQKLGTYWDRIHTYFELSFAEHVADIILKQAGEEESKRYSS